MRYKTIKTRNAFGQPVYVEALDTDGIIQVTREILKAQPENERAKSFLAFVDRLGRNPTAPEFECWMKAQGVNMKAMKAEDFEN